MNQLYGNIDHPLSLETKVRADKPNCPCKGGGTTPIIGIIKKVITNQTGNWYYLDVGSTISEKWVTDIL